MVIFCITKLELIDVNIPVKWQLRKILMDAMFITNKHQRPIGRKYSSFFQTFLYYMLRNNETESWKMQQRIIAFLIAT